MQLPVPARVMAPGDSITHCMATQDSYWRELYLTPTAPVIVIDQHTGIDPALHTVDGVHPNAAGEQKMAGQRFGALASCLWQ